MIYQIPQNVAENIIITLNKFGLLEEPITEGHLENYCFKDYPIKFLEKIKDDRIGFYFFDLEYCVGLMVAMVKTGTEEAQVRAACLLEVLHLLHRFLDFKKGDQNPQTIVYPQSGFLTPPMAGTLTVS